MHIGLISPYAITAKQIQSGGEILKLTAMTRVVPYAEIGASLQQKLFWSIVVVGLFLLFIFEFGCTQNIVHTATTN